VEDPEEDETFTVELQSDANDVLIVTLQGELDMADADWVEETLAAAAPHHRSVVIELDKLSFIDSTGLRALITIRQRAELSGIELRLSKASTAVLHTLSAAGLTQILDS
jgi:anti-sigma B factor antagonist